MINLKTYEYTDDTVTITSSDETNQYTYDEFGQLISTQGAVNASYTYDSRGNMLSKTVNGTTTDFAYTNENWQDQLTSVNGNALTYDANGNLASYDAKEYSWSHGKWLGSITDGENTYSYNYDSNGIRVSKKVNDITTSFDTLNGKILAQYDKKNKLYFQYNDDTPIGFVLNDTQYLYITNLKGDIVGITDIEGNLICKYTYDEWGKLLAIETAEENNAQQLSVAQINPLRYRGYYYDNESGLYYLQSRYYNPELCRFISADDFNYINTRTRISINAYAYCANNPVAFSDSTGHDFTWDVVLGTLKRCITIDFLFPLARYKPNITISSHQSTNKSHWVSDIGKIIGITITEIFTCLDLQKIADDHNWDFSFNNLWEYMEKKVDLYRKYFNIHGVTASKNFAADFSDYVSTFLGIIPNLPVEISAALTALPYATNIINDNSGRYITPVGALMMTLFNALISGIIDIGGAVIDMFVSPYVGTVFTFIAEDLYDVESIKKKAEMLAYNWYYLWFS